MNNPHYVVTAVEDLYISYGDGMQIDLIGVFSDMEKAREGIRDYVAKATLHKDGVSVTSVGQPEDYTYEIKEDKYDTWSGHFEITEVSLNERIIEPLGYCCYKE